MSNKIEDVAEALRTIVETWLNTDMAEGLNLSAMATQAIAAMREPTQEMIDAAAAGEGDPLAIWRAMVDAALWRGMIDGRGK